MFQRLKESDARVMAEAEADRQAINAWLTEFRREPTTAADLMLILTLLFFLAAVIWTFVVPVSASHQSHTDILLLLTA